MTRASGAASARGTSRPERLFLGSKNTLPTGCRARACVRESTAHGGISQALLGSVQNSLLFQLFSWLL